MNYKLTPEVCAILGISASAFNSWLNRNERFKAKNRAPTGAMLWLDSEIELIKSARNRGSKSRPK